jgi:hypothetical protein
MNGLKLFLLMVLSSVSALAQYTLPFPTSDAEWITVTSVPYNPLVYQYSSLFIIQGDTLINNISYHKIGNGNVATGVFRTEGKKVYYLNDYRKCSYPGCFSFPDTSEVLLYDFSLQVGDSILYAIGYNNIKYYNKITGISAGTHGDTLKTFSLQPTSYNWEFLAADLWIEGIGSNQGFFTSYVNAEFTADLACFHNKTETYTYDYSPFSPCVALGIENSTVASTAEVYPNPSNSIFTLNDPHYSPNATSVKIYNALGALLVEQVLTAPSCTFDLSNQSEGMYVVMLTGKNNRTVFHVVKN